MPVLGYLTPAWVPHLAAAFRQGLAEAGYEEGKVMSDSTTPVRSGFDCGGTCHD